MTYTLTQNAVRKIRRALTGRLGATGGGAGGGAPVSYDRYAAPFTVRWSAAEGAAESSGGAGDATSGAWVIWLPSDDILTVAGSALAVTSALDPADALPSGWYILPADTFDDDGDADVWLTVSGSTPAFAATAPSGAAAGDLAVHIASLSRDASTLAVTVRQFVSSSIVLAPSSAPRVVPGAGCFALVEGSASSQSYGTLTDLTFVNQYWTKGNRPYSTDFGTSVSSLVGLTVGSTGTPSLATPYVALKVPATPSGTPSLAAYATFTDLQTAADNVNYVTIPLYLFSATSTSIEVPEGDPPQWAVTLVADCDFRNAPRAQVIEVL